MINNPTAISKYKIQENVSEYPIGFEYSNNADGTPQLKVTINGGDATYGEHWVLSLDRKSVIVLAEEQEGARLTIRRDIPLIQESDYQVGRIDPEQIESDFDASVERDQMLDEHIEALTERVRRDEIEIEKNRQDIEILQDEQLEQDAKIAKNTSDVSVLKTDVAKAQSTADEGVSRAKAAQSTADDGVARAKVAQATADDALTLAGTKQDKGDYATNADLKSAITSERAISDGKYLPISDSKAFALKSALDSVSSQVDINRHDISDCKGDIAALEIDKQDKLVAGENIAIEGNVISSTGGKVPDNVLVNTAADSSSLGVGEWAQTYDASGVGVPGRAVAVGTHAKAMGMYSTAVGSRANASSGNAVAIGDAAIACRDAVAIGYDAVIDLPDDSLGGIAIGYGAKATASSAYQLGYGTNSKKGSFSVGRYLGDNYMLMDLYTGLIPSERLAAAGTAGQVLSKTESGMEWVDMSGGSSLPEMSDETTGKYLTNENGEVKWSDGAPIRLLPGIATGRYRFVTPDKRFAICYSDDTALYKYSMAIGYFSTGPNNSPFDASYAVDINPYIINDIVPPGIGHVSVGYGTYSAQYTVAVGYNAKANKNGSIQIGAGTTAAQNKLYIGFQRVSANWELLDGATGLIPSARFANEGTDGQVLVKNGDYAEWRDVESGGGGSGLPDQAGHTGYLMTDGTTASWSDKEPLVNNASSSYPNAISIKGSVLGDGAVTVGGNAETQSVAIGHNSRAMGRGNGASIAIGYGATANSRGSIQIGPGSASGESLFIGFNTADHPNANYKLLDADGHIPDERLPQLGSIQTALTAILGD